MSVRASVAARECGHEGATGGPRCCEHLFEQPTLGYHLRLLGRGIEGDLVCAACAEAGASATIALCPACAEARTDRHDALGVSGKPGFEIRLDPFDPTVREIQLGCVAIDIVSLEGAAGSWLVLDAAGSLRRVDGLRVVPQGQIQLPSEPGHEPWCDHALRPRLHASRSGRFVSVVNDYGRHGTVVDLETGRTTLTLDGGDYHHKTVPFSFAFVTHGSRTVAIHRTEWNRLDASDAETGALLTARGPTRYQNDEAPAHYLDYFHGRLHPSPAGTWLLDDGWIWHPVGVPSLWRIEPWLETNPFESQDGASRRALLARDYYWDVGMCWIDEDRLAVGGIGEDDLAMIDGVTLWGARVVADAPARQANTVPYLPGPRGSFFSDGRRLFSSDENGLRIWDLEGGALTGEIEGFSPTCQHRTGRQLAQFDGNRLRVWDY